MTFTKTLSVACIAVFVTISMSGCRKDSLKKCNEHSVSPCLEDINKTNIRIKNVSKYDYCNVTVIPDEKTADYGIIKSGKTSCYNHFDEAHRYAYIKLYVDGEEFVYQPIDYVGEVPLGTGKFTYSVDVHPEYKTLTIEVIED